MPSKRSSCSRVPVGLVSAAVSVTGAGNGLPLESRVTAGDPLISVTGGLTGSWGGMNSLTVPATFTRSPTETVGRLFVKTKTPSEVAGSTSASASGVWM